MFNRKLKEQIKTLNEKLEKYSKLSNIDDECERLENRKISLENEIKSLKEDEKLEELRNKSRNSYVIDDTTEIYADGLKYENGMIICYNKEYEKIAWDDYRRHHFDFDPLDYYHHQPVGIFPSTSKVVKGKLNKVIEHEVK